MSSALCRPTSSRSRWMCPSGVETGGGVQSAGAVELGLRPAQGCRQPLQSRGADLEVAAFPRRDLHPHGVQGSLAADAAARRREEMAQQVSGVEADVIREGHLDDVANALVRARRPAVLDVGDIARVGDHALREQEPHREIEVVPRCTHGDGDALLRRSLGSAEAQADLHGLLDGYQVRVVAGVAAVELDTDPQALGRCRRRGNGSWGGRGDFLARVRPRPVRCCFAGRGMLWTVLPDPPPPVLRPGSWRDPRSGPATRNGDWPDAPPPR